MSDNIPWTEGCAFAPRCPNVLDVCTSVTSEIAPGPDERLLRCHNPVRTVATAPSLSEVLDELRADER